MVPFDDIWDIYVFYRPEYFIAWICSILILRFRGLPWKTAKLKCREKCSLYPTAKLKWSEILPLDQKLKFCCFYSILMWFEGFFAKILFKTLWYRKIKVIQILVYRLNCEIKMPRNANMLQKYGEIKMPQEFHAIK